MANRVLYRSALLCGLIHGVSIFHYGTDWVYNLFLLWSIAISLLNHGYTHRIYQIADRVTMACGFVATYIQLEGNAVGKVWLCTIPIAYGCAKQYEALCYHLYCHGCITWLNVYILMDRGLENKL